MPSFDFFLQNLPLLLQGALGTVAISLVGLVFGFVIGTLVCAARMSRHPALRRFGALYVGFFRGVPLLVQLLLVYYFLPFVGLNVSPIVAAISAVSLCSASYVAEIMRGGFLGIPGGQLEAAQMLGLPAGSTLLRIQVPQAFRLTVPSLVNEMVLLIKASSLISVVGVAELTRTAQNLAASTFRPLDIYLSAGLIYFVINGVLSLAGHAVERQLKKA
ncbi:amino acid ABC transporter [Pandoraea terrae]|uniref:Amino acid ABC transporter n=1 Tax=Pandoraea terrae TaxID=1537710 RepID=A0A5E4RSN2_9BURK|nr:amino acid ABC transporter permease [Pandoraea terrae]VVD65781.1 amino acid ABC transporter [Pandoraea terrae]